MKIDLNEVLIGYDGKEIINSQEDKTPTTVRKVLEVALLSASPETYKTGEDKYKVYKILKRIGGETEEADLSAADVTLLKDVVAAVYGPAVVGTVFDLLDPEGE